MKFSEIPAGTSYEPALTTLDGQVLVKIRYRVYEDRTIKKFGALVVIDRTAEGIARMKEEAEQAWNGKGVLEYQIVREDPDLWTWEPIAERELNSRTKELNSILRDRAKGDGSKPDLEWVRKYAKEYDISYAEALRANGYAVMEDTLDGNALKSLVNLNVVEYATTRK